MKGIKGSINISDDILVFGKTQEEHDSSLKKVFQRLRDKGLTLNKKKCEFNKDKLELLGYVFSCEWISAGPKKVESVINLPTPSTVSEVRSLLGMTNYCAKFIPDTHPRQSYCGSSPIRTYREEPYQVIQKKGTMVTAQTEEGGRMTRNASWFKSVPKKKCSH